VRQRLIRKLARTRKNIPGPAEEITLDISSTPDYIISKPRRESKITRNWMIDQENDSLFKVNRNALLQCPTTLITPSGFCMEPQEAHFITPVGSGQ
jgi:hypothetical protein